MNVPSLLLPVGENCLTPLIAAQTTGEFPASRTLIKSIDVLLDAKERYA
jgi:hypothetical protein